MRFEPKKIKNLNVIVSVGRGTTHIPKDFKKTLIQMHRVKSDAIELEDDVFLIYEELRIFNFCSDVIRVVQSRISMMATPVTHRGAVYFNNEAKHYKINLRSESHLSTFTLEEEGLYVSCDHVLEEGRPKEIKESSSEFLNEILVIKKRAQPKLMLTPDRMTIKCNEHHEHRKQVIEFSENLRDYLCKNLTHSLRGCFFIKGDCIRITLKGGLKGKIKLNFSEKLAKEDAYENRNND